MKGDEDPRSFGVEGDSLCARRLGFELGEHRGGVARRGSHGGWWRRMVTGGMYSEARESVPLNRRRNGVVVLPSNAGGWSKLGVHRSTRQGAFGVSVQVGLTDVQYGTAFL